MKQMLPAFLPVEIFETSCCLIMLTYPVTALVMLQEEILCDGKASLQHFNLFVSHRLILGT